MSCFSQQSYTTASLHVIISGQDGQDVTSCCVYLPISRESLIFLSNSEMRLGFFILTDLWLSTKWEQFHLTNSIEALTGKEGREGRRGGRISGGT